MLRVGIPDPEVRAVAIVTRNGRIVGKVPLPTPLPAAAEKHLAESEDTEKTPEAPSETEDPY